MNVTTRFRALALLSVLTGAAACDDAKPVQLPSAPASVAPDAVSAYVAVSNGNPAVGSNVTVWVRARRGSAVAAIGSFAVRLSFDSTRLKFVSAAHSERGMVMANPATAGLVIAAGAAAEGFADDQLLATTFAVTGVNALKSLELNVTELNTVGFADQRSHTHVARGLYRAAPDR
jgi:hypothetical protein